ncbi:MAG: hypothetical protein L6V87_09755 [Ruminococcus sp.]|nr:MAG: hypothetical protein L6V87_09755 [Ruminococcus sp.]
MGNNKNQYYRKQKYRSLEEKREQINAVFLLGEKQGVNGGTCQKDFS